MESAHLFCTANSRIQNGTIWRNSDLLLRSGQQGTAFLQEAYDQLGINYPRFFKMDELCKTGMLAAHLLLENFENDQYAPEEVGIVLSNNNASIEADINYFESAKTFPSPSLFVYTLPNIIIGEISIRYGFKGENAFFIRESFDARLLHFYVNDLIQNHGVKTCICGWADVADENYSACFFLIEPEKKNGINFTPKNLNTIYNTPI